jgi:PAS domain S-box-containing protein
VHNAEVKLCGKHGRIHTVLWSAETIWLDGQLCALTTASDITDRKQAEETLRRERELLRAIIDTVPAMITLYEPDTKRLQLNREFERLIGWSTQDAVGVSLIEQCYPDPDEREQIRQFMESCREGWMDIRMRARDGRIIETSWANVRLTNGLQIGIGIDITARKRAETEVRRANAELQQFAHIVSHDLQEPLRTVGSFVSLLAKRYQGRFDADAEEYIAFAVDGARRMQQMIQDLLAYSRMGGQAREFTPIDCEGVLARVMRDLQGAITEQHATITHDPLPTVVGDGVRLRQVFQNLLGNALKFRGEAPPCVHISAQRLPQQWQLVVRDNGIGIDPTQMGRLFQVFQRLHPRSAYPGTGIGLAMCKKIVEQHGGQIWVESAPGQGAAFFFTLPLRDPESHGRTS